MSVVMDIYGLIRDLMTEAEKVKDDKLYSSLIDIKKQVNELDEENQRLKKQLDIREKMTYDEGAQSFILPDNPDIHYCSVCYAHRKKEHKHQKYFAGHQRGNDFYCKGKGDFLSAGHRFNGKLFHRGV